jgi:hypothetical protein
MSPTSYRTAPPRVNRDNGNIGKHLPQPDRYHACGGAPLSTRQYSPSCPTALMNWPKSTACGCTRSPSVRDFGRRVSNRAFTIEQRAGLSKRAIEAADRWTSPIHLSRRPRGLEKKTTDRGRPRSQKLNFTPNCATVSRSCRGACPAAKNSDDAGCCCPGA